MNCTIVTSFFTPTGAPVMIELLPCHYTSVQLHSTLEHRPPAPVAVALQREKDHATLA